MAKGNAQPRVPKGNPNGGQWTSTHSVNGMAASPSSNGYSSNLAKLGFHSSEYGAHVDLRKPGSVTTTKIMNSATKQHIEIETDFRGNVSFTSYRVNGKSFNDKSELQRAAPDVYARLFRPAKHAPKNAKDDYNRAWGADSPYRAD